MRERTILLHGFSKAFAMTGFRLGYACAPQPIIEAMMKIHQYCDAVRADHQPDGGASRRWRTATEAVAMMRDSYQQRRDFLVRRLNEIGLDCHSPGGAFYVFPDIRKTGLTSKEFAMGCWRQESVAAVPGDAFGESGEGFLRCCYATAFEDLKTAMDRIERFVGGLGLRAMERTPDRSTWIPALRTRAHVVPFGVFMGFLQLLSARASGRLFGWDHPEAPWWQRDPEQWIYPLQVVGVPACCC